MNRGAKLVEEEATRRDHLVTIKESGVLWEETVGMVGGKNKIPPKGHMDAPRAFFEGGECRGGDVREATKETTEGRRGADRTVEWVGPGENCQAPKPTMTKERKKGTEKREPGARRIEGPRQRPLRMTRVDVLAEGEDSQAPPRGGTESGVEGVRRKAADEGGEGAKVLGDEAVDVLGGTTDEGGEEAVLRKLGVIQELGETVGRGSESAAESREVEALDRSEFLLKLTVAFGPQRAGVQRGVETEDDTEGFVGTNDGDVVDLLREDARETGASEDDDLGLDRVECLAGG